MAKQKEPCGEKTRKPRAVSVYALVKVERIITTDLDDSVLAETVRNREPGIYAVALVKRVIEAVPATGVVIKPATVFPNEKSSE